MIAKFFVVALLSTVSFSSVYAAASAAVGGKGAGGRGGCCSRQAVLEDSDADLVQFRREFMWVRGKHELVNNFERAISQKALELIAELESAPRSQFWAHFQSLNTPKDDEAAFFEFKTIDEDVTPGNDETMVLHNFRMLIEIFKLYANMLERDGKIFEAPVLEGAVKTRDDLIQDALVASYNKETFTGIVAELRVQMSVLMGWTSDALFNLRKEMRDTPNVQKADYKRYKPYFKAMKRTIDAYRSLKLQKGKY